MSSSSNKYFKNWQSNHSNHSNNDLDHIKLVKKLDKDIDRLDRAIDKIKTEEKAKKIFASGKHKSYPLIGGNMIQQIQVPVPVPVQFITQVKYAQPQYIVINGCVMVIHK